MKKFVIVLNNQKPEAIKIADDIKSLLALKNAKVLLESEFDIKSESCDFILAIGGDGTIIRAAKAAAKLNAPLVGINMGRIGFTAELEPNEINKLEALITGEYSIKTRMLLNVFVETDSKTEEHIAVNDAVISRGSLSRMLDLAVYQNEENMVNYRADGVVVATPTGSTAYSLSAGGPVIDPMVQCMILAPICSHSLYARAVVFEQNSVLTICPTAPSGEDHGYLTIDGQKYIQLSQNSKVIIKKADKQLKMVALKQRNFLKHVSEKLSERTF